MPVLRAPSPLQGRPRGGGGVLGREPGAARVSGAPEGLAVHDRPTPGACRYPRRDPVGRASARRGGVVGLFVGPHPSVIVYLSFPR